MAGTREAFATETKTEVKFPDRFNVIVLNDDKTPMDFVIQMFVEVFNKSIKDAKSLMIMIHTEGQAIAGSYNKEIAEQKQIEAITMARENGFPLRIELKKM